MIKKYGWKGFVFKSSILAKKTVSKFIRETYGRYMQAVHILTRERFDRTLLRLFNYVLYGKGVLSRRELSKRIAVKRTLISAIDIGTLNEIRKHSLSGEEYIVVISHNATKTGAPLTALNIVKSLKERFNKHVIIILLQGGPLESDFAKFGIVVNLGHGSLTDMNEAETDIADHLLGKINAVGVNKCICNTVLSGSLVPLLKKYGYSTVNLIHEQSETIKQSGFVEATEKMLKYGDKIVFSSNFIKTDFDRNFESHDKEILIKPQGIYLHNKYRERTEEARALLRKKLKLPESERIVLGCGFGHLRKGVDIFFKTAEKVVKESKELECSFVWMGEWDESLREKLLKYSRKKGFSGKIILNKYENDPSIYFAGADVFLLPSRQDPFPSVVMNAMDCGVPVVAFDKAGGSPELLAQQQGIVVPYLDVENMSRAVRRLLNEDDLYKEISSKAKNVINKGFVFEEYVQYLLDLFPKGQIGAVLPEPDGDQSLISIVIPVLNGLSDHLADTLQALFLQDTSHKIEIIAIDSGSDDGTVEYLDDLGKIVRLYKIDRGEFGHGKTRQLGVELAEGEIVIFLVQDATPASNRWLDSLVGGFKDSSVVGISGRIRPRPEAGLLKKINVDGDLSGRTSALSAQVTDQLAFDGLSYWEKRSNYYFFNDISSAVRKAYLQKHPLPDVFFGEDVEFAKIAIGDGKKILYEPSSVVFHSHEYSFAKTYKRNVMDSKYHKKYIGIETVPTLLNVILNAAGQVKRDYRLLGKYDATMGEMLKAIAYSPIIHLAEQLGQYRGTRDEI